jgi:hypothetical protein
MDSIHGVMARILPRHAQAPLADRLRVMPAVVVTGARQTGKSTPVQDLTPAGSSRSTTSTRWSWPSAIRKHWSDLGGRPGQSVFRLTAVEPGGAGAPRSMPSVLRSSSISGQ